MSEHPTVWTELRRGLKGRCPNCGTGAIFRAFLKVNDRCPSCSEELFHHRADDFPAYLVIVIVGHLIVASVLVVETSFAPPLWLHAAIWIPLTTILAVALIQPVKGAVVAMQWRMGLDGFGPGKRARQIGQVAGPIPASSGEGL